VAKGVVFPLDGGGLTRPGSRAWFAVLSRGGQVWSDLVHGVPRLYTSLVSISTSPRAYYSAFLAVAGAVAAASTIAALAKGSFVYWLTAAGYVGFLAVAVGSCVGVFMKEEDWWIAGLIGAVVGAICLWAFPLTAEENADEFNLLSALGIVFVIGAFVLGVSEYEDRRKLAAPAMKTCPDCAREVLAAARKCEYCGYRFPTG
jgi:Uncharacterised protein family UPF0547